MFKEEITAGKLWS